ncbi:tyrosine-type recombinase/integrase [Pseudomonas sp. IT-P218]|uniref:tyrosine-type recombinase/integrase n=1 Tax=Pseudomonas sp. IT-P218 TaxID=3026449 RepID=UPI0039E0585C
MAKKINFTKSALDDLTCPDGKADILVYDTEIKGLAIRVTKAGGKTFFVVRKFKGRDHRIKLDAYDKRTTKIPLIREKALSVYTNLEATLKEKIVKSMQDEVTVESAFEDMLIAKAKLTECTVEDYRKTFKNHIAPNLSGRPLRTIAAKDVTALHKKVTEPVPKKDGTLGAPRERTANKTLSLLGSIFSFAIAFYENGSKKLVEYNPVDIMTKLNLWHENKRSKIRINPNELEGFITECLAIADQQPMRDVPTSFKTVSAAVLFMLFSGVRPGEIAKIRKSDIHHATRSIIFSARTKLNEQNSLKNGEEFHLVLSDSSYCQILYAMKHSISEYVFSGVIQEKISESSVRDFLIRIQDKVGKSLPRKIMRASFISTAQRAGIGQFYTKVLSNHDGKGQTVDVTDGYKTAYLSEVRDAITRVESDVYTMSGMGKDVVCRGLLETLVPLDQKAMGELVVHM